MFTGLVKEKGRLLRSSPNSSGLELEIACAQILPDLAIDDSVAVNGVCLTVTKTLQKSFIAQAVTTTLEKTLIRSLRPGEEVNLEPSLRVGEKMGGHTVTGHVNTIGKIRSLVPRGEGVLMWISLPKEFSKYLIKEGSIAVDGVSLTMAETDGEGFALSLIPHTMIRTNLATKRAGDHVNIEIDVLAKYVERFLESRMNNVEKISASWLREKGF
jgi:riboflavin synthase